MELRWTVANIISEYNYTQQSEKQSPWNQVWYHSQFSASCPSMTWSPLAGLDSVATAQIAMLFRSPQLVGSALSETDLRQRSNKRIADRTMRSAQCLFHMLNVWKFSETWWEHETSDHWRNVRSWKEGSCWSQERSQLKVQGSGIQDSRLGLFKNLVSNSF